MAKQVLTHDLDHAVSKILSKVQDFTAPLTDFYGYMLRQTHLTFSKLSQRGSGSFRGESWAWFADQYTRKDGTVVPAEGIPGQVKGRLRHSGKRVNPSARVMMDAGLLRNAALARFRVTRNSVVMQTPQDYADEQQKMRPFAFITRSDVDVLRNMIIKHLV